MRRINMWSIIFIMLIAPFKLWAFFDDSGFYKGFYNTIKQPVEITKLRTEIVACKGIINFDKFVKNYRVFKKCLKSKNDICLEKYFTKPINTYLYHQRPLFTYFDKSQKEASARTSSIEDRYYNDVEIKERHLLISILIKVMETEGRILACYPANKKKVHKDKYTVGVGFKKTGFRLVNLQINPNTGDFLFH